MKKPKCYLSGRMSGLDRETCLARFRKAEERLAPEGYRVTNPCRVWLFRWPWLYRCLERIVGQATAYDLVLLYDLWLLSRCDRLHLIGSDWMSSRGAKTEQAYAQAKGITITIDVTAKQTKK